MKSRLFGVKTQRPAISASQITKREPEAVPVEIKRQPARPSLVSLLLEAAPGYTEEQIEKIASKLSLDDLSQLSEVIGALQAGVEDPESTVEGKGLSFFSERSEEGKDKAFFSERSEEVIGIIDRYDVWDLPNIKKYEKQYQLNIEMEFARRRGTILKDRICPRCGGNEYLVNEAQLAGADEGNTEFRQCVTPGCIG